MRKLNELKKGQGLVEYALILVLIAIVLGILIAWGNLDGGPWADYLPGIRRFWRGRW